MIVLDRREFLGVGAAGLFTLTSRASPGPVRVALLAPELEGAATPGLAAALDGARLGAEEVAHTFTLLGREIEVVEHARADAIGIVSLLPDDALPDAPLVIDACALSTCSPSTAFRVGGTRADTLLWHETLHRYGAQQLNERFRRRYGRGMDQHAWAGWFALKVVAEAALRARSDDPAALATWLLTPRARFDGHKGRPLAFDADRRLIQPAYRIAPDGIEQLEPGNDCAP